MQSDFSTADEPEEGPILVSLMSAEYQTHDQERLSGLRDDLADSGYIRTRSLRYWTSMRRTTTLSWAWL